MKPGSLFKYGSAENVSLSEAELAKLKEKLGPSNCDDWIEVFSLQKAAHGYKYKNDYSAILSWVRKESKAGKPAKWPMTSAQLTAAGWKCGNAARCTRCKAVIFWATTPSTRSLPLSVEGENWRPHSCA